VTDARDCQTRLLRLIFITDALRCMAREMETLSSSLYLLPRNATRSRNGNKPLGSIHISHSHGYGSEHPNKSPLKISEKGERGRIQRLSKVFGVPPIISGTGKAANFRFCTHIHRIDRNKSPLKISGKVAVGVYSGTL